MTMAKTRAASGSEKQRVPSGAIAPPAILFLFPSRRKTSYRLSSRVRRTCAHRKRRVAEAILADVNFCAAFGQRELARRAERQRADGDRASAARSVARACVN